MRTSYSLVTINAVFQELALRRLTREALTGLPSNPRRLAALGHRGRDAFTSGWGALHEVAVRLDYEFRELTRKLGVLIASELVKSPKGHPAAAMAQALGELRALECVPELSYAMAQADERTLRAITIAMISLGESAQLQLSIKAVDLPTPRGHDVGRALLEHGEEIIWQGQTARSLVVFRFAQEIFMSMCAREPEDTQWQCDLSTSYARIGYALAAQGKHKEAEEQYRSGLAIIERLATNEPDNMQWQRELSICHNNLGDALSAQGQLKAAEQQYRQCLSISEHLVAREPYNTELQHDLALSYERVGF